MRILVMKHGPADYKAWVQSHPDIAAVGISPTDVVGELLVSHAGFFRGIGLVVDLAALESPVFK